MFYDVVKKIVFFIFHYLAKWEVYGLENIPEEGAVILASNHESYWDPVVIGAVCPRKVRFMARKELFSIILLGWIIRSFKAFPVDREVSDRAAIKSSLEILKNGEVLALFPEGTRIRDRRLGEFKNGASLIALKSGAPVVPIALINTRNIFSKGWFRKFKVHIGRPLIYPELQGKRHKSQDVEKITEDLRKAIDNMIPE